MNKSIKKIGKFTGITIASILVLVVGAILSLQIPSVQNFVKDKLVSYLEEKIHTNVDLQKVYIDFPNQIVIENLFIEGKDVDTLLYVNKLNVGINLPKLIKSTADITDIQLNGIKANVNRNVNGDFNFKYILDAFATNDEESSDSKPFIISLDKIDLKNLDIIFNDQFSKNDINLKLAHFNTRVKTFDLEENTYAIDAILVDGLKLKLNQGIVEEVTNNVVEKVDSLSVGKPLNLKLAGIDLKNFDVSYGTEKSKMYVDLAFKNIKTKIKKIDLENNSFALDDIFAEGLKLQYKKDSVDNEAIRIVSEESNNSDSKPFLIDLQGIDLNDFTVSFDDKSSEMKADVIFEKLNSNINKIDLENNNFEVEAFDLLNSKIEFSMNPYNSNSSDDSKKNEEVSNPLNFLLNDLNLENVAVKFDNNSVKKSNEGLDFNHLNFSRIDFKLENLVYNNEEITGNVKNALLKEQSGLQVTKFKTDFSYAQQQAFLKNLYLETPKTLIQEEIVLNFDSQDALTKDLGNVSINANLPKSKIAFSDILLLVPSLKNVAPFNNFPNAILKFDTNLNGKINDLFVDKLAVSGLGNTIINANGRVKNAMNPDKLWFDFKVNQFASTATDVEKIIPKGTLPSNISLPQNFDIKGNAKGSINNLAANLNLNSSFGNANIKAVLNQTIKNKETYVLDASLNNFQVGKLIKNDSIGKVSATLKVKGTSFDFEQADAYLYGIISSAEFNSYVYKDLNLNGKIANGDYDIEAKIADPNVNFAIQAQGNYTAKSPTLKLDGNIIKIDLFKIGFSKEPMAFAGKINGDFTNLNPDFLNGNLSLHDFALAYKNEIYPLSEVKLDAISNEESNEIHLKSQIIDANIIGKYKITELATQLQQTINTYYNLNLEEKENNIVLDPAYFEMNVAIKDDDIIRKFLPDLNSFETINLYGNFNSEQKNISLTGNVPELIYGKNKLKGIDLSLNNESESLKFGASIAGLENESFVLNKMFLDGNILNNVISYDLRVLDVKDVLQYQIAGQVSSINDVTEIALLENGLKLNYDNWSVNPENKIQFSSNGLLADKFGISNNGSEISIQSANEKPNSPLNISINNFSIETITELIKKDSLPASGIINGTAQLNDLQNQMNFISDITISDLNVFGSKVGNLSLKVDNENLEQLNADVQLSGFDNDLKIKGYYNLKQSAFDLNVDVNKLQMKSLEGFSMKMIDETEGFISGNLKVKGNLDKPSILGDLKFNQVGLHVNSLNATFKNIDDKIVFNDKGLQFSRFKINDTDGNSLVINGKVLTETYSDFKFDLNISGRNFKLINSEKANNNMLYGTAALNVNLNIKGDMNLPKVDGQLKVTEDTDFTFVLPQSSPALQEREGIIEFIDQDQLVLQETIQTEEIFNETQIKGLDVSVNIVVDKDAKLSIVIDRANGDFIKLQGEAQLTGGIDPSGKTTLVGTYEVKKGAYEMSVNVLKRKFEIEDGSTIIWTGEPTKADVNITAIYKTKTAPLDLLQQQLTTLAASDLNQYKQQIPFETLLMMKGELLKPIITFDIKLNDENPTVSSEVITNVNAKLDQLRTEESELNKQVFALLLLNRFIGENPFESSTGMSAESMARQSVSKILSQQLNNLAADLISGVEINFDLESSEDYTTGEKENRTDLNVGLSKTLLSDRLKVNIGSNFGLEGSERENETSNNIAGDVSLEYMLSKDGRYMLRAYRKNEYQVALQGQIIETGVGFIITIEYNEFKEIFKRRRQNKTFRQNQNNLKRTSNEVK